MGTIAYNGEKYSSENNVEVINEYKSVQKVGTFSFDNSGSSLESTTVQGAIDELSYRLETESILTDMQNTINGFVITIPQTQWDQMADGTYVHCESVPEIKGTERLDAALFDKYNMATPEECAIFDELITDITTEEGIIEFHAKRRPDREIQVLVRGAITSHNNYVVDFDEFNKVNASKLVCFDTVSNLINNDMNLIEGTICRTLGYYTPGDGGAACYKVLTFNSSHTASKEGMTFVKLPNGLVGELITDGETINIKQLGALGYDDDLTDNKDNTSIIKYALNHFSNVIFNHETYLVNGLIKVADNHGLHIYGNNACILQKNIVYNTIEDNSNYVYGTLMFNDTYNVVIDDLIVDNMNADNPDFMYAGIRLNNCHRFVIRNCDILKHNYGIFIMSSAKGIIENTAINKPNKVGLYITGASNNIKVDNCVVHRPRAGAYYVDGATGNYETDPKNIKFVGCNVNELDSDERNNTDCGLFYTQSCSDISFDHCSIDLYNIYHMYEDSMYIRYPIVINNLISGSNHINIINCKFAMNKDTDKIDKDILFINGSTSVNIIGTEFLLGGTTSSYSGNLTIEQSGSVNISSSNISCGNIKITNCLYIRLNNNDLVLSSNIVLTENQYVNICNNLITDEQHNGKVDFAIVATDNDDISITNNIYRMSVEPDSKIYIRCNRFANSLYKLDIKPYLSSDTILYLTNLSIPGIPISVVDIPTACLVDGQLIINEEGNLLVNRK